MKTHILTIGIAALFLATGTAHAADRPSWTFDNYKDAKQDSISNSIRPTTTKIGHILGLTVWKIRLE